MEKKFQKELESIINKLVVFLELDIEKLEVKQDKYDAANTIFNIKMDDPSTVIGKHGETLNHLQHIVRLIFRKKYEDRVQFSLDINDYREERRKNIIEMVNKAIRRVIRDDEPIALDPMNAYERRIAHAEISKAIGIISESIGEEPNRKVVIKPSEQESADDLFDN